MEDARKVFEGLAGWEKEPLDQQQVDGLRASVENWLKYAEDKVSRIRSDLSQAKTPEEVQKVFERTTRWLDR